LIEDSTTYPFNSPRILPGNRYLIVIVSGLTYGVGTPNNLPIGRKYLAGKGKEMNLTFNDLLVISQLIEDKADQATEDQRDIYVKVRQEIRERAN
jgi:hypothetical protein